MSEECKRRRTSGVQCVMTTPIYRLLPALTAWWVSVGLVWAGYDEYMTCGSGNERYGRQYHHFPELPCDISKNSWCESAGTQYPWGAVRRFVYENQGLMKRMYGNQRHYNVLRAEVLNELYEDMFDEMPKRHHQYQHSTPPNTRSARYQNPSNSNSFNSESSNSAKKRNQLDARAMKVTMEPDYVGLQQAPTTDRSKSQSKASKTRTKGTPVRTNTRLKESTRTPTVTGESTKTTSKGTTSYPPTTITEDVLTTSHTQWVEGTDDTGEYLSFVEEKNLPTVFPPEQREGADALDADLWTTLSDSSTDISDSLYSTPYSNLGSSETYSSYTSVPEISTVEPLTTRSDMLFEDLENADGQFSEGFISTPLDEDDLTTLTLSDRVAPEMKVGSDAADYSKDEIDLGIEAAISEDKDVSGKLKEVAVGAMDPEVITESGNLKVELREQVVDELRVEGNVREEAKTELPTEPIKIKRPVRGINACPVKEEFVAPYWANNTRGDTLALLNLYPFEQYVQWERCMYENRQMYCRAGCRCEQQYRLHKLLAFDPTNECRGIFSDWFRFPSCCVCKCYDLPQDLFMSNHRRPRINQDDDDEEFEDYFDDIESEEEEEEEVVAAASAAIPTVAIPAMADFADERKQLPVKTNPPLANIPPQRRPRLPPRPHSHVSAPSLSLVPPPPSSSLPSQNILPLASSGSLNQRARLITSTESPEVSTLGTVDVATPHYYFNISNYARILFSKGHPVPLSRIPRSPEE